jgi:hypothetical protein
VTKSGGRQPRPTFRYTSLNATARTMAWVLFAARSFWMTLLWPKVRRWRDASGEGHPGRGSQELLSAVIYMAMGVDTCSWPTNHWPFAFWKHVVTRTQ